MTVAASGFGGCCHPEAITAAVEERFVASGKPRNLTLLFAASTGDRHTRGMGHFGYEGLVACVIAGGWRGTPRLGRLAIEEKIEAHCWPQGVIAQLYRAIAAGQPGVITHIGLGSFMDPLHGGGRMNATTPRALVERVSLRGKEWLLYPSMPLDCVLLRGTTADEDGNITLEDEAFPLDVLAMAQAGRNSGGIVIVQVKRIAERGSLPPGDVRIPAALVDYVVVCENPAQHGVSFAETDNIAYTGRVRMAVSRLQPAPLSADKIIQRRAFLELAPLHRPTINLGIGIAAGIGRIASEEGFDDYTVTIESGVIGGVPAEELSFGAASIRPRSSHRLHSSIFMTAAASISPFSAWPRWIGTVRSMSAASTTPSLASVASPISRRQRGVLSISARFRPAARKLRLPTAGSTSSGTAEFARSSTTSTRSVRARPLRRKGRHSSSSPSGRSFR
nr:CoA-transferase [Rhizobium lentis]